VRSNERDKTKPKTTLAGKTEKKNVFVDQCLPEEETQFVELLKLFIGASVRGMGGTRIFEVGFGKA